MDEQNNNPETLGNIRISEEVVATVAGLAAAEVKGVAGMSNNLASGIYDLIGKKNLSKGVKVDINEQEVIIDLFIVVEYGSRIPEVAWEIQEKVKKSVETMTGLDASKINIHIQGVKIEKEAKDDIPQQPTEETQPQE